MVWGLTLLVEDLHLLGRPVVQQLHPVAELRQHTRELLSFPPGSSAGPEPHIAITAAEIGVDNDESPALPWPGHAGMVPRGAQWLLNPGAKAASTGCSFGTRLLLMQCLQGSACQLPRSQISPGRESQGQEIRAQPWALSLGKRRAGEGRACTSLCGMGAEGCREMPARRREWEQLEKPSLPLPQGPQLSASPTSGCSCSYCWQWENHSFVGSQQDFNTD